MFRPTNWMRIDLRELGREQTIERMTKELRRAGGFFAASAGWLIAALVIGFLIIAFLMLPAFIDKGCQVQPMPARPDEGFSGIELAGPDRVPYLILVFDDGVSLVTGIGYALCGIAASLRARRMLRNMADTGRPFDLDRARELMRIGQLLMCTAFVVPLLGQGLTRGLLLLVGYAGDMPPLSGGGLIAVFCIMLGVVLMAIARIFEYGCVLQDQDDRLL